MEDWTITLELTVDASISREAIARFVEQAITRAINTNELAETYDKDLVDVVVVQPLRPGAQGDRVIPKD